MLSQGLVPSQESSGTVVSATAAGSRQTKGRDGPEGGGGESWGGGTKKTCRHDPQMAAGVTAGILHSCKSSFLPLIELIS